MATLKINESGINDSGTDKNPSWTETGAAGNTFAVQSAAASAALKLTGTAGDVVLIEGKSTDYAAKLSGKILTLANPTTKQVITLALVTDSVVNFAFLDGSLDMSLATAKLGAQKLTATATKITATVAADDTSAKDFFTPTTQPPVVTGEDNVFTLTEVAPTLTKTFLWDGVDTTALKNLVSYANQVQNRGGDKVTTTTSNDTAAGAVDGTFFDTAYVDMLNNIISNVKYANLVDEKLTANPAFLSTSGKTVGVIEGGVHTTANDDLIVAGTSYALNGAYLNGGAGNDTLEVEMKGPFAQPKQLISIETVKVHNVTNYYDSAAFGLNNSGRNASVSGALGVIDETKIQLGSSLAASSDSILDLTHANKLENLEVSESAAGGQLTILGIKNYPKTTLEGGFTQNVNLHYTTGQKAVLDLKLVNVDFGDSVTNTAGQLNIAHNAGHIRINSDGFSNVLESVDFGAKFQKLTVEGTGQLIINSDLNFGVGVATIDASKNTGGLTVDISKAAGSKVADLKTITINGSTVDDTVTINGTAAGATLKINLGTGDNNVLNVDSAVNAGKLSVITGDNLTLNVNAANVDLTRANISGVDAVVIKDGDTVATTATETAGSLKITDAQFKALGADKFVSDHNTANANVNLKIVVATSTSLTDLLNSKTLDSNVKLSFDIAKGATLTLTAEQLDNYVANDGIDSTGVNNGKVIVNNAGLKFDAFQTTGATATDGGDLAGTAPAGQDDFVINRSLTGYERAAVATGTDTLVVDSTGTATLTPAAISSGVVTTLKVLGNQSVDFKAGAVSLGNDFKLDFSGLTDRIITPAVAAVAATATTPAIAAVAAVTAPSTVQNLTIANFNNITTNLAATGSIVGNGNARINVELNGNVGKPGNADGLKSSGVSTYVVTKIGDANADGQTGNDLVNFYTCDNTKDVTTLGLQGNKGNTVYFQGVPWGGVNPKFVLEGDGYVNFSNTPKAVGNPDQSSIGTLKADFFYDGAPAVVEINNQGKALGTTSTGAARPFHVDGIDLGNAKSLELKITEGNAIIEKVVAHDSLVGNVAAVTFESLKVSNAGYVTINDALPTTLTTIDASGVASLFTAKLVDMPKAFTFTAGNGGTTLTLDGTTGTGAVAFETGTKFIGGTGSDKLVIDGTVSLDNITLTSIEKIEAHDGADLTLSIEQFNAVGSPNITFVDANTATGSNFATLNLAGLGSTPFVASALNTGIHLGTVIVAAGDATTHTTTLAATTDLTGIGALVVPEGTTLNLTAAQFQQLDGKGTITGIKTDGTGATSTDFTVNITDLKQTDVDHDDHLVTGGSAGFDLSGITATNKGTLSLASDVVLTDADHLGNFAITLADNQDITFSDPAQADARSITAGVNTSVTFGFAFSDLTANEQVDPVGSIGLVTGIDTTNYKGVDTLTVSNTLVQGQNVEQILFNLESTTRVNVVAPAVLSLPDASPTDRVVNVEAAVTVASTNTTTPSLGNSLIFANLNNTGLVKTLDLTLNGDSSVPGLIDISTLAPLASTVKAATFDKLTIHSNGAKANTLGNIQAGTDADTNLVTTGVQNTSNDLLNVDIQATDAALTIGKVMLSAVANNTDGTGKTATVTVSGSKAVTIEALNTADGEVGTVNVVNNNTAGLTITGGSPALDDIYVAGKDTATTPVGNSKLETLNLSGTGTSAIKFGTKVNDNGTTTGATPTADDYNEPGVQSATLSVINAGGTAAIPSTATSALIPAVPALAGALDLGRIAQIDSTKFTFTSGTGVTTLSLDDSTKTAGNSAFVNGATLVLNDAAATPAGGWNFDLSTAAATSTLTIDDSTTFSKGAVAINLGTNATGTKTVVLHDNVAFGAANTPDVSLAITGTNGTLQINGDVDFTKLGDAVVTPAAAAELNLSGIKTIQLDAGATLKMSDAQFAGLATGTTFTGAGQTLLIGTAATDLATDLATASDLTKFRGVTAIKLDEDLTAGAIITMTPEQAAIAKIVNDTPVLSKSAVTDVTWDKDNNLATAKVARDAGDFRIATTGAVAADDLEAKVQVNITKTVDLTAVVPTTGATAVELKGVDKFVLPNDTALTTSPWHDIALTINNTDIANLVTLATPTGVPATQAAANLAQLSGLTVKSTIFDGTTDSNSVPRSETNSFAFTYDATTTKWAVSGNSAAMGSGQVAGSAIDALLAKADTIVWNSVGSTFSENASAANGTAFDLKGYAGAKDTFKFGSTVDTQTPGGTNISTFDVAKDVFDFTALIGAKDTAAAASTLGISIANLDLSGANVANIIELTDVATITAANFGAAAGLTTIKTVASSKYIVLTDDNAATTNIYYVTTDATNAATVNLVGTVDIADVTTLLTANFA